MMRTGGSRGNRRAQAHNAKAKEALTRLSYTVVLHPSSGKCTSGCVLLCMIYNLTAN